MNGFYEGGTRSQHRVGNNNHFSLQFRAGYIVKAYFKASVFIMLAVSRNKSIIGFVKVVEKALVKGEARPQNSSQYRLLLQHFMCGNAQRGLNFPFFCFQLFAYFISSHFADAF